MQERISKRLTGQDLWDFEYLMSSLEAEATDAEACRAKLEEILAS